MPAARRMHCIDKARTPTMRCVRRGTPAARSSAHRPLQDEGPYAASQFPKRVVGSVFWRDAQAGVPSAEWPRAQLAFKDSMVRGILQFTPGIAFRYVLHRCESRDIRCRESFRLSPEEGAPPTPRLRGRAPSTQFPWRFSRRGSFASRAVRGCVPPRPARTRGAGAPRAQHVMPRVRGSFC